MKIPLEMARRIPRSPVEEIVSVRIYRRPKAGLSYRAVSPAGHLLHYVVSGSVEQKSNENKWALKAGDVFWHADDEFVCGKVITAPWLFYSVHFFAPHLPPPPTNQRRFSNLKGMDASFERLWKIWNSPHSPARLLSAHAELTGILARLVRETGKATSETESLLWWNVERRLRKTLHENHRLPELARLAGCSVATLSRSCLAATGMPAMKRLKHLRMSLARGWVASSSEPIGRIAERLGYPRVHEFSRDFRKQHRISPRQLRQRLNFNKV